MVYKAHAKQRYHELCLTPGNANRFYWAGSLLINSILMVDDNHPNKQEKVYELFEHGNQLLDNPITEQEELLLFEMVRADTQNEKERRSL